MKGTRSGSDMSLTTTGCRPGSRSFMNTLQNLCAGVRRTLNSRSTEENYLSLKKRTAKILKFNIFGVHPNSRFPPSRRVKSRLIYIQYFDGSYNLWPEYRHSIEEFLEFNPDATELEKFSLLYHSLIGRIRHFVLNKSVVSNFQDVWDAIIVRYEREGFIASSILEQFLHIPAPSTVRVHHLRAFYDSVLNTVTMLSSRGALSGAWSPLLATIILSKLPTTCRFVFEEFQLRRGSVELNSVLKFLHDVCSRKEKRKNREYYRNNLRKAFTSRYLTAPPTKTIEKHTESLFLHRTIKFPRQELCINCREWNRFFVVVYRRTTFSYKKIDNKYFALCANCASFFHIVSKTRADRFCTSCGKRHHILLHWEEELANHEFKKTARSLMTTNIMKASMSMPSLNNITPQPLELSSLTGQTFFSCKSDGQNSLLTEVFNGIPRSPEVWTFGRNRSKTAAATPVTAKDQDDSNEPIYYELIPGYAPVRCLVPYSLSIRPIARVAVLDGKGRLHFLRCIFDTGSSVSVISRQSAQLLSYPLKPHNSTLCTHNVIFKITQKVSLPLYLRDGPPVVRNFLVSPGLLSSEPPFRLPSKFGWDISKYLPMADPVYFIPGRVDLLIGADLIFSVLLSGIVPPVRQTPFALETTLGWILMGSYNPDFENKTVQFDPSVADDKDKDESMERPGSPQE